MNEYQENPEVREKKNDTKAVIGLILGIASILFGCCGWYGILFGVPGVICSILSRRQKKSPMSVAGIVCSGIGIMFGLLMMVVLMGVFGLINSDPAFSGMFFDR